MSTFGVPAGLMGFTGVCQLEFGSVNNGTSILQPRVTSCDLSLKQGIVLPNVTNPSFGRMVFNVQPEIIEGTIEYPIVVSQKDNNVDATPSLWNYATIRDYNGRLSTINVYTKAANYGANFKYTGCVVNTFGFSTRQEDKAIKVSAGLMGMDRQELPSISVIHIRNARAAVWGDAVVGLYTPEVSVSGSYIRSFSIEVNNNCERFYTGGGDSPLKVQDICAKNFDVGGTIMILGRHVGLSNYSIDNPKHYLETSYLEFGYSILCQTNGCDPNTFGQLTPNSYSSQWKAQVPGVLFQIEEIALTNNVFETVVKWSSAPADNPLPTFSVFN